MSLPTAWPLRLLRAERRAGEMLEEMAHNGERVSAEMKAEEAKRSADS
jgi:hypothetical protein